MDVHFSGDVEFRVARAQQYFERAEVNIANRRVHRAAYDELESGGLHGLSRQTREMKMREIAPADAKSFRDGRSNLDIANTHLETVENTIRQGRAPEELHDEISARSFEHLRLSNLLEDLRLPENRP